jgi:hypothetical protein
MRNEEMGWGEYCDPDLGLRCPAFGIDFEEGRNFRRSV